jgi:hypothetical protein
MEITIARCGLACEVCTHFINQGCHGCEKENGLESRCLLFRCAQKKNVQYCLQCDAYPCMLMVGLSRAYCPIYTKIKAQNKSPLSILTTKIRIRAPISIP